MSTIEEVIGQQKAALLLAVKERIVATATEVVQFTPSRSGRTRCSLQAAIGQAPTGTDPRLSGREIDPSGQSALDQIGAVVDALQPGDKLFVASDYANFYATDEGGRHMAPHQQIERAAIDWSK